MDGADPGGAEAGRPPRVVRDLVRAVRSVAADPVRVLEVGAGRRLDVAVALAGAFPDAEVLMTDRKAPDLPAGVPGNVRAAALDLEDGADAPGSAGGSPLDADVVVAVRLPPELWPAAEALADRLGAPLVVHPLPEETPPEAYEQVHPGVYVRRPASG